MEHWNNSKLTFFHEPEDQKGGEKIFQTHPSPIFFPLVNPLGNNGKMGETITPGILNRSAFLNPG